jgi:two-component sensor histidine kinase
MKKVQGRICTMALLHELLYRSGTLASIDLGSYLRQLSMQAFRTQSTHSYAVKLELNLGSVQVGMDQAVSCGLLVNELISNCLKHGFPDGASGQVNIELQPLDIESHWRLRVCDTGVGLPENFEEKRNNSLGLQLAGDLAKQIGGNLTFAPNQGKGVSFIVNFKALAPVPLVMPA